MYVQTLRQYGMHVVLDDRSRFCILLLFATGQRSGITQITEKKQSRKFDHMLTTFLYYLQISASNKILDRAYAYQKYFHGQVRCCHQ